MSTLFLVFIWRVYLFAVAAFSSFFFSFSPQFPYSEHLLSASGLPQWLWAWGNFDGVHYLTIAKQGYSAQFTQVFFPVYPLVLRIAGFLFHDQYLIITGLILSTIFFVAGLIIFHKLIGLDFEESVATKALLLLVFFPVSFYFAAVYTESLFFLLTVAAFYLARQKKWWWCGLLGLITSATRITGIVLLPSLLVEYLMQQKYYLPAIKKRGVTSTVAKKNVAFLKIVLQAPLTYLIPLGLISYMIYLQIQFNDALYFWHAQEVFGAERIAKGIILPPQVVWRYLKILATVPWQTHRFWVAVLEFASFFVAVGVLIAGHLKKIRLSYLIFAWLIVLIPTLTGTFSSLPRYILMVLPLYIMAGLLPNKIYYAVLGGSILLLSILTSVFIRGLWVA